MKIIFRSVAVALMTSVLFFGCSKDDDSNDTSQSKTQILTSQSWKLTGATVNGSDIFPGIEDCIKDNFYTFQANGTGTADEGATKCDPADPQTSTTTWSFNSDETVMTFDDASGSGSLDFTLVTLTTSQLRIRYDTTIGVPVVIEQIYGKR